MKDRSGRKTQRRGRPSPLLYAVVCLWLLSALAVPATAQTDTDENQVPGNTRMTEQILSSYEGQNVSSVEIAGRPDLNASQFMPLFQQHAGEPFSMVKVDATAAALKAQGKFAQVRVEAQPEPNGVRVLFVLEPAVYFGIYRFPGAQRFAYPQLAQVANYPIQTPYSSEEVERDRQSLLTFFRQEGYFRADVRPEVETDTAHAIANIDFHVTLGDRAKFGSMSFEGAPAQDESLFQHKLESPWARLRGAAIRPGKTYHRSTLNKAVRYLQGLLEKQGYLGAQVTLALAEYDAGNNRADIDFAIKPGALTHVDIKGAHLWNWTRKSLLPMFQGIGVDEESLQEGQQELLSYFQAKGYFDVKVDTQLENAADRDTVTYRIDKGKKHKVTKIAIAGATHVRDAQLLPTLTVQKRHWFSPGKFSSQMVRSSVDHLKAVYAAEGYGSVQVEPAVTRNNGNVQITFRITEGPRDIVNSLKIEGARTLSQPQFAPDGLKLAAGQPYSAARVQADRGSILSNYLRAGFLNASFRETATEVSKQEPHRINVVYHIFEGPQVNTGNVIILGRQHTQERLIRRDVSAFEPGLPLTETELLTAGSSLYDHTGVFDWAQVDPKREITTQTKEDVLVKVHEAKRNEFTYGLGFEVIERGGNIPSGTVALPNLPPIGLPGSFTASQATFYGPRGTVQYTRNNMRGKGESLSLTAFAGRLDQRGAIYYIDPSLRWSSWRATTSFSAEHDEENPIFSSQVEQGSLQVQRSLHQVSKDNVFLRYSFSKTDLTRILIPQLVPAEDQHIRLSTLAANFTRDTRDNPLDEHRGVLASLELDVNATRLGSSVNFTKFIGQAAYFKEKFRHIVWADSFRLGRAHSFAGSFVPLSEKFFSGGGNTLRGFPLDGAGPQRAVEVCPNGTSGCNVLINVPSGDNNLLIFNSEARIPLPFKKGLGLVPFYDGGNVLPSFGWGDLTKYYSNNVGLGLRYSTPVGPIRIDVGRNLNPVPGVSKTQYFISIGQAF